MKDDSRGHPETGVNHTNVLRKLPTGSFPIDLHSHPPIHMGPEVLDAISLERVEVGVKILLEVNGFLSTARHSAQCRLQGLSKAEQGHVVAASIRQIEQVRRIPHVLLSPS